MKRPIDVLLPHLNRELAIVEQICVKCGDPAQEFRDALSRTEFGITGFCQKCQDMVFEEPKEEEVVA